MSHKCPDCGYGCRNFNEQHTHVCKPFTIKDIDLNHEKDVEKYIKNPFDQMSETGPEPEKTALEKIDEADKEARDEKYR